MVQAYRIVNQVAIDPTKNMYLKKSLANIK